MYTEIQQIKSFEEIEALLFKNTSDNQIIEKEIKSLEYKNRLKRLGARYLIKASILEYIELDDQFNNIEIENEESGKPVVHFKGLVEERIKLKNIKNVNVSISHSRNHVATLVVIE